MLSAAQDLRTHKESLGIRTKIVTTTKILQDLTPPGVITTSSVPTDQQIKTWIINFNDQSWVKLKWLLLMGDTEYLPTHYIDIFENNSKCAGDQYFGQFNGDDLDIPSIGIGRFPVDSLEQANRIVQRIIDYELNPPSTLNSFFRSMSFAAEFQDDEPDGTANRWFAETSEDIRNHLIGQYYSVERIYATPSDVDPQKWYDGTPIPNELKKPGFPWDGDRNDIISSVNAGRIILYHRDHGSKNGWGTPGFNKSNLNQLSISDNKYPFVFSINCASGVFDNETANLPANIKPGTNGMNVSENQIYWAEKFFAQDDGAIGIVGDTRNSSTVMNNLMAKGLFDAMFPFYQTFGSAQAISHMGNILNHAKAYVANSGHSNNAIKKENTIYNLFGDPSLKVGS